MRRKTGELLRMIRADFDKVDTGRVHMTEGKSVFLRVCDIDDENPGVRYTVSAEKIETSYEGEIKLSVFNPLRYRAACRRAQEVVGEAYTYLNSEGVDCTVQNIHPRFL